MGKIHGLSNYSSFHWHRSFHPGFQTSEIQFHRWSSHLLLPMLYPLCLQHVHHLLSKPVSWEACEHCQLCFHLIHLVLPKDGCRSLSLKISILGVIAGCQVLNNSHSLLWIPSVEVPIAGSIKSHLILHCDASEESTEQLYFIESMVWTISLIRLESDPGASEWFCRLLSECSNLAPQVFSTRFIEEVA